MHSPFHGQALGEVAAGRMCCFSDSYNVPQKAVDVLLSVSTKPFG